MDNRKSDIPPAVNAAAAACTRYGLPFIGNGAEAIVAWGEYLTMPANEPLFEPAPELA
jgi:hypothetical protein